jgi:hypothetical protein
MKAGGARRSAGALVAVFVVLLAIGAPASASATLREDTARTVELLVAVGASTPGSAVEFLEAGKLTAMGRSMGQGCTVFVALTTRNNAFSAVVNREGDVEGASTELAAGRSLTSANGLVVTSVCDPDEVERALVLRFGSPRGAVAVVWASVAPELDVGDLGGTLRRELGREDGPDAPRDGVSPPLVPAPLAKRRSAAAERARRRGATNVVTSSATADRAGEGQLDLALTRGCHALRVMSKTDGRGRDLDVELSETDGSKRWRDRSDLPDGHLSICVSSRRDFQLAFKGAFGGDTVFVDDAISPLPEGVPDDFGARALEELSELFFDREAPGPTTKPIVESLGAQGTSWLTFEAEPGRCYLGTVALLRGASRGMRLSMGSDPRPSLVEASSGTDALLAHVCAEEGTVPVRVDVPGGGVTWVFLAWVLGASPLEAP